MMNLYLDIETIPAQAPEAVELIGERTAADALAASAAVKAPANYKDQDKIDAYIAEKRAELQESLAVKAREDWLRSSFDGGLGQVVAIGFAVDDSPVRVIHVDGLGLEEESELLRLFFEALREASSGTSHMRPTLIGHNLIGFDLPFITKRSIVHGRRPPIWWPRNPKPWSDSVYDTMHQWAGDRDRISLDKLCRILGLPGKEGMTGADVWPAVEAGRIADVAAYCAKDVARVRAVHQRMTYQDVVEHRVIVAKPGITQ